MSKRRTDKERLDWIEERLEGVGLSFRRDNRRYWYCGSGDGDTPRQAIDAAMDAEGRKP